MKHFLGYCIMLLVSMQTGFSQGSNYHYDPMGRLTADHSEEIVNIEWNNFNKISKITRADTSNLPDMEFVYDAFGNRKLKIVKPRSGNGILSENHWNYSYYTHDFEGNILCVYDRSFETLDAETFKEVFYQKEKNPLVGGELQMRVRENKLLAEREFEAEISSAMYFADIKNESVSISALDLQKNFSEPCGDKFFELSNHTDNILVVVSDRRGKEGSNFVAHTESVMDYYPFGMSMSDRTSGPNHNYGFGGNEMDNEINGVSNSYTTFYRQYDPRLGRWLSIDPEFQAYPMLSPYTAFANNPVMYLDKDGDVLQIHGSDEEKARLMKIINDSFGGTVKVTMNKTGVVSMQIVEGGAEKMNKGQKALHRVLNTVITNKATTHTGLVSNPTDKDKVLIGQWRFGKEGSKGYNVIDLDDVEKLTGPFSAASAIAHEVVETYLDQVQNLDFDKGHEAGLDVQAEIDGVTIKGVTLGIENETARAANLYYFYEEKVNNKTIKRTYAISTVNGDVTGVKVLEGWESYKQYDVEENKKRKPFKSPTPPPPPASPPASAPKSKP